MAAYRRGPFIESRLLRAAIRGANTIALGVPVVAAVADLSSRLPAVGCTVQRIDGSRRAWVVRGVAPISRRTDEGVAPELLERCRRDSARVLLVDDASRAWSISECWGGAGVRVREVRADLRSQLLGLKHALDAKVLLVEPSKMLDSALRAVATDDVAHRCVRLLAFAAHIAAEDLVPDDWNTSGGGTEIGGDAIRAGDAVTGVRVLGDDGGDRYWSEVGAQFLADLGIGGRR